MAEQAALNRQVGGSTPLAGTMNINRAISDFIKQERYGWPIYFINKYCREDGNRLEFDFLVKEYDPSNGEELVRSATLLCPYCRERFSFPMYLRKNPAHVEHKVRAWLEDDCAAREPTVYCD